MEDGNSEPFEVGIVQREDGTATSDERRRRKTRIVNLDASDLMLDDEPSPLIVHRRGVMENLEVAFDEKDTFFRRLNRRPLPIRRFWARHDVPEFSQTLGSVANPVSGDKQAINRYRHDFVLGI
jgi:hypothetical protein